MRQQAPTKGGIMELMKVSSRETFIKKKLQRTFKQNRTTHKKVGVLCKRFVPQGDRARAHSRQAAMFLCASRLFQFLSYFQSRRRLVLSVCVCPSITQWDPPAVCQQNFWLWSQRNDHLVLAAEDMISIS